MNFNNCFGKQTLLTTSIIPSCFSSLAFLLWNIEFSRECRFKLLTYQTDGLNNTLTNHLACCLNETKHGTLSILVCFDFTQCYFKQLIVEITFSSVCPRTLFLYFVTRIVISTVLCHMVQAEKYYQDLYQKHLRLAGTNSRWQIFCE